MTPGEAASRAWRLLRSPTVVYLAASGLARLGALVLIPLYTRKLSPAAYGDYALAQTMLSMLPTIMSLGLLAAIPRAYFAEKDRKKGLIAAGNVSAWTVAIVLAAALALFGVVLIGAEPSAGHLESRWALSCVIIAATGSVLTTIPAIVLRSSQRPIAAAAWQLMEFGLVASSGIFFVGTLGRGVGGAIEALAFAYGICGLLGIVYVVFLLRGRLRRGIVRGALVFALPFVPHFLANWSQLAADRWSLKLFGLENELGRYVLAMQLAAPVSLAMAAFHDSESARIGEVFREGGLAGLRKDFGRMQRRYLLASVLPAVVVLLAMPIFPHLLGPSFRPSIALIPFVLGLVLIDTMYFPSSHIVYFAGRTKLIPAITIVSALFNVGLNLLFVPVFGVHGALLARAGGYAVRSGAMWVAAHRSFRVPTSTTVPKEDSTEVPATANRATGTSASGAREHD